MFHCQNCGKVSKPGEKSVTRVLQTQDWVFPARPGVHKFRTNRINEYRDDPGGTGLQILKEIRVGKCCKDKEIK